MVEATEWCNTVKQLIPHINRFNISFLKLYDYFGRDYSPSDIDVLVSIEEIPAILKSMSKGLNIMIIKKRRFLTDSYEILVPGSKIHVDLYTRIYIVPHLILTASYEKSRIIKAPAWCTDELPLPTMPLYLDLFHILFHALRHKVICPKEYKTFINAMCIASEVELRKFLAMIIYAGLEDEFAYITKILAGNLLNEINKAELHGEALKRSLRNTKYLLTLLRRCTAKNSLKILTMRITEGMNLRRRRTLCFRLDPLYILYLLKNLKSLRKVKDLYYIFRILFIHVFYEYTILILLKLRLLR